MAEFYVRSDGSDTDPYDTWAKAATSLKDLLSGSIAGQTTTVAAGDVIYVDDGYTETNAGNTNYEAPSNDVPIAVISVDSTGDPEPPGASDFSPGATITHSSGVPRIYGASMYAGFTIETAYGPIGIGGDRSETVLFYKCTTKMTHAHHNHYNIYFGIRFVEVECEWYTDQTNAGPLVNIGGEGSYYEGYGCSGLSGTTAGKEEIVAIGEDGVSAFFHACDFSAICESGVEVLTGSDDDRNARFFRFSGCKFPASYNWNAASGANSGWLLEGYSSGSSPGVNDIHVQLGGRGIIVNNDTTKLDSDFSLQFDNEAAKPSPIAADALEYQIAEFFSSENPTITVELVFDSNDMAELYDNEFWIEVEYPDSTTPGLTNYANTRGADVGMNKAALTSSSASWSGTGGFTGSAVKRKVAYTVSGGGAGVHRVRAHFMHASEVTVYVEPKVTLS